MLKDLEYFLQLHPNLYTNTLHGSVSIVFTSEQPSDCFVFHIKRIQLNSVTFNGETICLESQIAQHESADADTFKISSISVQPNVKNIVHFVYTG